VDLLALYDDTVTLCEPSWPPTIFLPEGVLMLVGYFVVKYFAGRQVAPLDVTPYLEEWLPQLVSNFVAPLLMLSIVLLIGGVVLLTVSFVYKRQTSS